MVSHLLWALGKMSRWTSKLLDAQNGQPLQDLVFRQAVCPPNSPWSFPACELRFPLTK